MQMIDVHFPTTDGRNLILSRYTQPEKDVQLLLHQLNLTLPDQPPPRIEDLKKKCEAGSPACLFIRGEIATDVGEHAQRSQYLRVEKQSRKSVPTTSSITT